MHPIFLQHIVNFRQRTFLPVGKQRVNLDTGQVHRTVRRFSACGKQLLQADCLLRMLSPSGNTANESFVHMNLVPLRRKGQLGNGNALSVFPEQADGFRQIHIIRKDRHDGNIVVQHVDHAVFRQHEHIFRQQSLCVQIPQIVQVRQHTLTELVVADRVLRNTELVAAGGRDAKQAQQRAVAALHRFSAHRHRHMAALTQRLQRCFHRLRRVGNLPDASGLQRVRQYQQGGALAALRIGEHIPVLHTQIPAVHRILPILHCLEPDPFSFGQGYDPDWLIKQEKVKAFDFRHIVGVPIGLDFHCLQIHTDLLLQPCAPVIVQQGLDGGIPVRALQPEYPQGFPGLLFFGLLGRSAGCEKQRQAQRRENDFFSHRAPPFSEPAYEA